MKKRKKIIRMPLICSRQTDYFQINLWYLTEDISFFYEMVEKYADEYPLETGKNKYRKLQWLAARYLLHHYHPVSQNIYKTPESKPLAVETDTQISISHSKDLVVTLSSSYPCGIDIQKMSGQIHSITEKFVSEKEQTSDRLMLYVIWGAKEAIYKANGLKSLNFKRDILVVTPDSVKEPYGRFTGLVITNACNIKYDLEYEIWNEFMLITARETLRTAL